MKTINPNDIIKDICSECNQDIKNEYEYMNENLFDLSQIACQSNQINRHPVQINSLECLSFENIQKTQTILLQIIIENERKKIAVYSFSLNVKEYLFEVQK